MAKQTHWYHCTEDYHGQTWRADRICPRVIGANEPKTPRLCVASNVCRCFAARLFTRTVYVYRTERPRRAVKPLEVWDSPITQERWLIPPVNLILVDTIPEHRVREASKFLNDTLHNRIDKWKRQHRPAKLPGPTHLERLIAFNQAIEVLGDHYTTGEDRRFVMKCLDYFKSKEKINDTAHA